VRALDAYGGPSVEITPGALRCAASVQWPKSGVVGLVGKVGRATRPGGVERCNPAVGGRVLPFEASAGCVELETRGYIANLKYLKLHMAIVNFTYNVVYLPSRRRRRAR
jgi:hypothetical protein